MKKLLTVAASVALLCVALQRKYKAVVDDDLPRRQGRSAEWKVDANGRHRASSERQKLLIPAQMDPDMLMHPRRVHESDIVA